MPNYLNYAYQTFKLLLALWFCVAIVWDLVFQFTNRTSPAPVALTVIVAMFYFLYKVISMVLKGVL